ncbi:MAG: DNA polymerase I [Chloroflexi bacterium UTCFX4]|jgi:DNA polymerase-1|nr:MAG: DNA polymerase I [Chloroflexi bacterium UTCFX4]
MSETQLLLIDAHALIHRSYHAIERDLTSPSGEPTKAVYGFASTLLKVIKERQPQYVIATFDAGKSFRAERFAAYKANRPPTPDDLKSQFARCQEFCRALNIPVFVESGYEADDLIGTLSKQAQAKNLDTLILTGDRDTLQLVDGKTNVLMIIGQTGELKLYDAAAVVERFGFAPAQLIDFKALRGDASDNIPGVAGVGDKTATKLIQAYENVEGIYAHLNAVEGKMRDKLADARAQVELNKQLVTIDRAAPVTLDVNAARFGAYDRAQAVELARELGFQSLLPRLPDADGATDASAAPVAPSDYAIQYAAVISDADLDALVERIKKNKAFVVDVETTDIDPQRADLVGIAIGVGGGEAYYIPVAYDAPRSAPAAPKTKALKEQKQASLFDTNAPTLPIASADAHPFAKLPLERVRAKMAGVFADPHIEKYAHNASYDWGTLRRAGFEIRNFAFDTMIAAHLLENNPQAIGLKNLAFQHFGAQMTEIQALIGKGKNQITMAQVSVDKITQYASADADYTYRLFEKYKPLLSERGLAKLFYEIEMPLVAVIVDLEAAGVLLDLAALHELSREIAARLDAIEKQVYALVGAPFNLNSPMQLSEALFEKLGLSSQGLERTSTGKISTAAGALETLRDKHPVIPLILEHRELSKLRGTYADALPQLVNPTDGRVHTSFNQAGAVTGRLSSSNPNLQNIPARTELGRRVRRAFIAPPGSVLVSADYSQVELRILAHVSQDPNLLQAFAHGEDIHASTAATLFNVPLAEVTPQMRRLGKTINFGVVYGISDWGVAGRTELSLEDSRKLINDYYARYPRVREYLERTKALAREQGYVESLLGRRRYFPELASGRKLMPAQKNQAEREAINMPIQATAADIIKIAMTHLHSALLKRKFPGKMILQVHDELVFECPQELVNEFVPLVRRIMADAYPLDAPLQVEVKVGANWDEMSKARI